jgi:hypothetical protein
MRNVESIRVSTWMQNFEAKCNPIMRYSKVYMSS